MGYAHLPQSYPHCGGPFCRFFIGCPPNTRGEYPWITIQNGPHFLKRDAFNMQIWPIYDQKKVVPWGVSRQKWPGTPEKARMQAYAAWGAARPCKADAKASARPKKELCAWRVNATIKMPGSAGTLRFRKTSPLLFCPAAIHAFLTGPMKHNRCRHGGAEGAESRMPRGQPINGGNAR